jgi:LPXTG-site transpeptidase (sortase) family protein
MARHPLLALGVALTTLGVVLLSWGFSIGVDPARVAPVSATTQGPPPAPTPTARVAGEPRQRFAPATTAPPPATAAPAPAASPADTPRPAPPPSTVGLRIRIPAIGLDRRMSGEGLSPKGTIDPAPGTVMWFQGFERVRPGSVGTAVIAAHVATGSRPDVFADLADVDVGDTVQVVEKGKTVTYRVTRASAIDKTKVTTDQAVWGTNSSRSRLAIITCDDAFGFRGDGHRKANFVVIAERV